MTWFSLPKYQRLPSRWGICALLFFATTINYMDRQILGILAPTLQREIGWSEVEYGAIVTSFQGAYALGLLLFGYVIDRLGSKRGLIVAVFLWSIASIAHGWVSTVIGFALARFTLGLAEAGNFPASIKTVSESFPKRERALAIGIFNGGANIGAVLTPILVPFLAATFGWRAAFYVIGSVGFIWVFAALRVLRSERSGTLITVHDVTEGSVSGVPARFRDVAGKRIVWAFTAAKFLTDPIWWFYLYWSPKYFSAQFQVDLAGLAAPLVVIYLMADLGSIGGGWISSRLISRGVSAGIARKRVMFACSLVALSVVFAAGTPNLWVAVILLGLATAAHQGWSANLFAAVSDAIPTEVVGIVVGVGGMAGAIGGMLIATLAGFVLESSGSYLYLFLVCGSSYLIAWVVFTLIAGNYRGVRLPQSNELRP